MLSLKQLLATVAIMFAAAAQAQVPADEFIKNLGEDLLATVKADKAVQAGDANRIRALVEEKVAPQVNVNRAAQQTIGRHWRTATPEQQAALVKEFRTMLMNTYGNALAAAKDAKLTVRPLRAAADETDVTVRTQVALPKGDPIQLDYRVEKSGNSWKIFDLNILGSWMTQNFQSQFNAEIEKGGIDGLIANLKARNAAKK